jgi:hypothetical protein
VGDYLKISNARDMTTEEGVTVGEHHLAYLWLFERRGNGTDPIHLLRVEALGVPQGLVVDRIGALPVAGHDEAPIMLGNEAEVASVGPKLVPVDTVTVRRACLGGGNDFCPGWKFFAIVHLTAPGSYVTHGVRITYQVQGRTYYQDVATFFGLTTGSVPPTMPPF